MARKFREDEYEDDYEEPYEEEYDRREPEERRPLRPRARTVFSLALVFFAVFAVIGWFDPQTMALDWMRLLGIGLVGPGYYLIGPAFLFAAAVMLLFRKNNGRLRVLSILSLPVLIGIFWHAAVFRDVLPAKFSNAVTALWDSGLRLTSGGVISGGLGNLLVGLVGRVITILLVIVLILLALMGSLHISFRQIGDWIKAARARQEKRDRAEAKEILRERGEDWDDDPEETEPEEDDLREPETLFDLLPFGKKKHPRRAEPEEDYGEEDDEEEGYDEEPENAPAPNADPADYVPAPPEPAAPPAEIGDYRARLKAALQEAGAPVTDVPAPFDTPDIPLPGESSVRRPVYTEPGTPANAFVVPELDYRQPSLDLLEPAKPVSSSSSVLNISARNLKETLEEFGIDAKLVRGTIGPTVHRIELELGKGVRFSRLLEQKHDLELALGASKLRILPIPNVRSGAAIEVPNRARGTAALRSIVETKAYQSAICPLALGADLSGRPVVGDPDKLRHLLIGGAYRSGKTTLINGILTGLLTLRSPKELKLVLIDPGKYEYNVYFGLPHLYCPVIGDTSAAAEMLGRLVKELLRRQSLFAARGVRTIAAYNVKELSSPLPRIVIVIDELSDLMTAAGASAEESICRIARSGAEAGIHMIAATRKVNEDVLTLSLRSAFPSRAAMLTMNGEQSRLIIDSEGAEQLLGNGDYLLVTPSCEEPARIQAPAVDPDETLRVTKFLRDEL